MQLSEIIMIISLDKHSLISQKLFTLYFFFVKLGLHTKHVRPVFEMLYLTAEVCRISGIDRLKKYYLPYAFLKLIEARCYFSLTLVGEKWGV